ncbi:MAG: SDR family oxidoreductase [Solirubrobacteraceae bacterium]
MSDGVLGRFSLRGTSAIVTGAARGLGHAMALALAEAGADIIAVDGEPLGAVDHAVTERGARCATRELDLRALTPDVAADLIAWSRSRFDDLSVLVNNAGMIRRAPAAETSAEDWHEVIGLNLTAPFFLAQAFGRRLLRDGERGSIVNVVSMNSFQGGMEVPAYTASKHGLLGITRALANEWTAHGIRVNGIAPGWMSTDLTVALREDSARDEALLARMPIGRWGEPGDLAGAVVYLASDASSYVSGSFIAVDGGWLAR